MKQNQVALVRRFKRAITQRIGALDNNYLSRGRPLGLSRLLWEIGPARCEVKLHSPLNSVGYCREARTRSGRQSDFIRASANQGRQRLAQTRRNGKE